MNVRVVVLGWVAASSLLLSACGDADRALKTKLDETERAQAAVESYAPLASEGWKFWPAAFETAHPYKNRESLVYSVTHPGSESIRLHFSEFHVESGYDWVKVSTPEGGSAIWYTGRLGDFWTSAIPGSTVRIEFVSDASVRKYGFVLAGYAAKEDGETWNTKTFVWHTAHPYLDGDYQVVEISEPSAKKMKILFGELSTEANYDFVRVYDEIGRMLAEYSGNLAKFETPAFAGSKLYVVFSADESITATGVSIAEYSYVEEAGGCVCPANYDPVCGANGQTYSNTCAAGCAAIPVNHPGTCGVTGDFCGGIASLLCAEGYRCEPEGNWPDAGGTCVQ